MYQEIICKSGVIAGLARSAVSPESLLVTRRDRISSRLPAGWKCMSEQQKHLLPLVQSFGSGVLDS